MARRVTVNIGFITNSSSCVYYFPKEVLADPQVKAFLEAHELTRGYIGEELWYRSECASFLVTEEQKAKAKDILRSYDPDDRETSESSVSKVIDPKDDGVYILYGDEYQSTTHILCRMMSNALAKLKGQKDHEFPRAGYVTEYN